jgi:hypothetical protein
VPLVIAVQAHASCFGGSQITYGCLASNLEGSAQIARPGAMLALLNLSAHQIHPQDSSAGPEAQTVASRGVEGHTKEKTCKDSQGTDSKSLSQDKDVDNVSLGKALCPRAPASVFT